MGVADVQPLQRFTLFQTFRTVDILAEGRFQHLQIFAGGKGLQIADHGAGDNDVFQAFHAGNEGGILQILVVADVHEPNILQILEVFAAAVRQIVGGAENLRVTHGGGSAADTDPPDHLGAVPVVVPELCHDLVGDLAVFQNESLAVGKQIQCRPNFAFSLVADLHIFNVNFLLGSGKNRAEEVKAVVDDHIGGGLLQGLHILLGQLAVPFPVGQDDFFQRGQHGELLHSFIQLPGGHGGQVKLRGVLFVNLPQQFHLIAESDVGEAAAQSFHLFQSQLRPAQYNGGQLGQMREVRCQGVKIKVLRAQRQLGGIRSKGCRSQRHTVVHIQVRQPLQKLFQHEIIAALTGIHLLKVRKVGCHPFNILVS